MHLDAFPSPLGGRGELHIIHNVSSWPVHLKHITDPLIGLRSVGSHLVTPPHVMPKLPTQLPGWGAIEAHLLSEEYLPQLRPDSRGRCVNSALTDFLMLAAPGIDSHHHASYATVMYPCCFTSSSAHLLPKYGTATSIFTMNIDLLQPDAAVELDRSPIPPLTSEASGEGPVNSAGILADRTCDRKRARLRGPRHE
ncbi:hypothetical protein BD626DRAFT_482170 [Schizophyllum amplum]|uniref:Uncharacterized protein n=1 Tax=Schizophyllum amplum TaxID=97359 RepID=A0A550CUW0_9AGAR|nr:hypothetical protein BD626DRAFT_482170 [Auriculariopsis ampla]